ncbi:hypothetical protein ADK67_16740 [Saccharothrix sp. NRRL B-16348]|uniref:hypothetical protein n=1 Tax=Saccharothrix sp. NRRL B-16348 TaxID=1415542 RepID=UPI0006AD98F1|nr:hypothetical protein [Saccharothrix sp. NRRL B-16348]KOX25517.1 hypothetical protein ADK67_16740 [Saccharothrix sp. NRRL B-16348]
MAGKLASGQGWIFGPFQVNSVEVSYPAIVEIAVMWNTLDLQQSSLFEVVAAGSAGGESSKRMIHA